MGPWPCGHRRGTPLSGITQSFLLIVVHSSRSDMSATTRHEHWRMPDDPPAVGESCFVAGCDATFALPAAAVAASENDERSAEEVYADVRAFMEILAIFVLAEERRRGRITGISVQEAHVHRTRLERLWRAKNPGRRARVG